MNNLDKILGTISTISVLIMFGCLLFMGISSENVMENAVWTKFFGISLIMTLVSLTTFGIVQKHKEVVRYNEAQIDPQIGTP